MKLSYWRAYLERLETDHQHLTDTEVFHLSCAVQGWHVMPRTPAGAPPIAAEAWLAAALSTRGRYLAPEAFGHPADLRDGGPTVDSVVLMAIVQRHFLRAAEPGWDDEALAEQLGLDGLDVTRAQVVLDRVHGLVRRGDAPLGAGWWRRGADEPLEAR